MIFELIKTVAPVLISSLIDVDDWTSPIKQENPFISATGLALKSLVDYIENDSVNTSDTKPNNGESSLYDIYSNKSYKMEFK